MKFARNLLASPMFRATLVVLFVPISFFGVLGAVYGIAHSASMMDVTIPSVRAMRATYQADLYISIGVLAGFVGFWGRIFVPTASLADHPVSRFSLAALL